MLNRTPYLLLLISLVLAVAVWVVVFLLVKQFNGFNISITNKFGDFDFAVYAFGLVAVAVSCAGVYVSLLVEPAADQLVRMLEVHLVPDPFDSIETAADISKPMDHTGTLRRSAQVKVVYAITQLVRWATLSAEERAILMGPEGLDAESLKLGKRFNSLQNELDRRFVIYVAVVISVIYAIVPFVYYFERGPVIISILGTLYILCVGEIAVCACLYRWRSSFLNGLEMRIGTWRADLDNFLQAVLRSRPPATGPS